MPAPSRPIVIVHGYSDRGKSASAWCRLLSRAGYDATNIHVSEYVSLSNEVTIKDIAEGFDRSLRIREGILTVREKTMTFANIQQTSIRQNPLQRLLGIQDVQVRTAGGGGGSTGSRHGHGEVGEAMHEAYFRGVDNAEEIRTAILERVRLHRDSGLGDPDEPEPDLAPAAVSPPVAAAHELLAEIRALRSTLTA